MHSYIGTPTSRVDGRAKVTGEAKYAAEFNTPGLAYGSVVTSTIPKGRIVRIDASEALRVAGVLDVLTPRQPAAHGRATTDAYKDDVAPETGSPFRPLYDDKIMFSGQPIALVLAEEWEIARSPRRSCGSNTRGTRSPPTCTPARGDAFAVEKPEKPRGDAR